MTTWRYRVTEETVNGESIFSIREVYYNDDNKIIAYSVEPVEPSGSTKKELIADLGYMIQAFSRDVIKVEHMKRIVEENHPNKE